MRKQYVNIWYSIHCVTYSFTQPYTSYFMWSAWSRNALFFAAYAPVSAREKKKNSFF